MNKKKCLLKELYVKTFFIIFLCFSGYAATAQQAIFTEDFESTVIGTDPTIQWVKYLVSGTGSDWQIKSGTSCAINSNTLQVYKSSATALDCTYDGSTASEVIVYREVDALGYYELSLAFNWVCEGEVSIGYYDYGSIVYSTNGTNWTRVDDGAPDGNGRYYGESTTQSEVVSLPPAVENKTFLIGVRWKNDAGTTNNPGFSIDDIVITAEPGYFMSANTNTACSGTLYDSGGPYSDYSNNENYTYTIAPIGAGEVSMTFLEFEVEDPNPNCADSLTIYDNDTKIAGPFCGDALPNGGLPIIASSGIMKLKFVSDNTNIYIEDGWKARWNCESCDSEGGTLGNDTTICESQSLNLLLTGYESGADLQWQKSIDGLIFSDISGENSDSYQSSLNVDTWFRVSVFKDCQSYSDTVFVEVSEYPIAGNVSVNVDSTCFGDSIKIVLSGYSTGVTLQWQFNTGEGWSDINGETNDTLIDHPVLATQYRAEVMGNCLIVSDTVNVFVYPEFAAEVNQDTIVCHGDSVQLIAFGGNKYSWYPTQGLSCSTCDTTWVLPDSTITYSAIVEDTICSNKDTANVVVEIKLNTVLAEADGDTTICKGSSAQLSASGGNTYQWMPAEGLNCTDCPNPTATPDTFTVYKVIVGDSTCHFTDSAYIEIDVIPTTVADAGEDKTICLGDSVELHARGGDIYSWSPATGLSCTDCQTPKSGAQSTITYTVSVTNTTCNTSDEDDVTVIVGINDIAVKEYYVNDNSLLQDVFTKSIGDDTNDGLTPYTPKRTISALLNAYNLEANDVVFIDAGTYQESITITSDDEGSSLGKVTLQGAGSDKTVVDGGSNANGLVIQNAAYIQLSSVEIVGAINSTLVLEGDADFNIVSDCSIKNNNEQYGAIHLIGTSTVAVPDNNVITSCIIEASNNNYGIHLEGWTSTSQLLSNEISFNTINILSQGAGSVFPIIGSTISYSGFRMEYANQTKIHSNKINGGDCGLHFLNNVTNTHVYNNYISGNRGGLYAQNANNYPNFLYNNSFYSTRTNVYLNDFGTASGWKLYNNIFYNSSNNSGDCNIFVFDLLQGQFEDMDNNLYYHPGNAKLAGRGPLTLLGLFAYNDLSSWQATNHTSASGNGDANSVEEDPNYINISTNNLDLNGSSIAKLQGRILPEVLLDIYNKDRGGLAVDIGAHEQSEHDMEYVSSVATQAEGCVTYPRTPNVTVLRLEIETKHAGNPINLTELVINSLGTTDNSDIENLRLFYTENSATLDLNTAIGIAATVSNSDITIASNQPLIEGENYIWVTYDVKSIALVGNQIDGSVVSFKLDNTTYTPVNSNPVGNKTIIDSPSGDVLVYSTCSTSNGELISEENGKTTFYIPVGGNIADTLGNGTVLREVRLKLDQNESCRFGNGNKYSAKLISPSGTEIELFANWSFNDNARVVDIKFRDDSNLVLPNNISAEPWHIGYYRTVDVNAFNNFNGVPVAGDWQLVFKESTSFEFYMEEVELIFGPSIEPINLIQSNNDACANAVFLDTDGVYLDNSIGKTAAIAEDPDSNIGGCNWNSIGEATSWYNFIPDTGEVKITVSGEFDNARAVVVKVKDNGVVCNKADWEVVINGCPAQNNNDNYSTAQYDDGSSSPFQIKMDGLAEGELYYLVLDGATNDSYYIEIEGTKELGVTFDIVNESADSLGEISVNIVGGYPPYSIYWDETQLLIDAKDSIPFLNSISIADLAELRHLTGLKNGDYDVTIKDSRGNSISRTITVGVNPIWTNVENAQVTETSITKTATQYSALATATLAAEFELTVENRLDFQLTSKDSEVIIGLRNIEKSASKNIRDFDIGLYTKEGKLYLFENGLISYVADIKENDQISLGTDGNGSLLIKINNNIKRTLSINNLQARYRIDAIIRTPDHGLRKIRIQKFLFIPRIRSEQITHASCLSLNQGAITVSIATSYYSPSYYLSWYDDQGNNIGSGNSISGLQAGQYQLVVNYLSTFGFAGSYSRYYTVGNDIVWSNPVDASVSNTDVHKNSTSVDFDAGAFSLNYIPQGDNGCLKFEPSHLGTYTGWYAAAVGLNENNVNQTWQDIDYALGIVVSPGMQGVAIFVLESGDVIGPLQYITTVTSPFEIVKTGNVIRYKVNGAYLSYISVMSNPSAVLKADVSIYRNGNGIKNCAGIMECPEELNPDNYSYAHLHKQLSGGYYYAIGKKIKFKYDEEYRVTLENLTYKVFNTSKELVADKSAFGSSTVFGSPSLIKTFGYNEFLLDLTGMININIGEYYILEISNDKNEKKYLKVKM